MEPGKEDGVLRDERNMWKMKGRGDRTSDALYLYTAL